MKAELTQREREIVDCVRRRGKAAAVEVQADLGGRIGNSAVRTMLGRLEEKGYLDHEHFGKKYLYRTTAKGSEAGKDALKSVVRTFFKNSAGQAIAALLDEGEAALDEEEVARLKSLLEKMRREGR